MRSMKLTALAMAGLVGMSVVGCGGASQKEIDAARAEGAKAEKDRQAAVAEKRRQAQLEAKVRKLEADAKKAKAAPTGSSSRATSSGGGSSCGSGLSVGSNTSCAFAENVRSEWISAGAGTNVIYPYSPVTGRTYEMHCVAGIPTVCRGGNNAVVYIR